VDQVGEQGDAARGDEDRRLNGRRYAEDEQREANRAQSGARAFDALVDEAVGMAVAAVRVGAMIVRSVRMLMRATLTMVGMRPGMWVGVDQRVAVAM